MTNTNPQTNNRSQISKDTNENSKNVQVDDFQECLNNIFKNFPGFMYKGILMEQIMSLFTHQLELAKIEAKISILGAVRNSSLQEIKDRLYELTKQKEEIENDRS